MKSTVPDFLMTVADFGEIRTIIQYERWHIYISVNQTCWFKSQAEIDKRIEEQIITQTSFNWVVYINIICSMVMPRLILHFKCYMSECTPPSTG